MSNGWLHRGRLGWQKLPKALSRAIVAACLLLGITGTTLGYEAHFSTLRWLDDIPVTSLRDRELGPAIHQWWDHYKSRPTTVLVADTAFSPTVAQLGYEFDESATLAEIRHVRRLGFWKLRREYKSSRLLPAAHLNESELDHQIDEWEKSALTNRPTDAELVYEKGGVVVHPGRAGFVVDRVAARQLVLSRIGEASRSALVVPLVRVEPQPDATALESLRADADRLVKAPVVLEAAELSLKIHFSRAELGRLLKLEPATIGSFNVVFDADALIQLLRQRRIALELPAKNASLAVTGGNRFSVVPEKVGYKISESTLPLRLLEAARSSNHRGLLDVEMGEPAKVKAADVEHLGIRELMGAFTTRHPCCQPRVNNIHRIADLLDGVIVLPGETFSVNEFVGPRTLAHGFVMAPSIEDGEMVETIGGGVSQFATTMYNALLRAGLEILERRAHTYWFDRYPMGHEATLSIPKPDLVFRNDTKSGVLIHTEYTDKTITVKIYGDMEGRRVAFGVSGMQEIEQFSVERLPNSDIRPDKERTKNGGRIGWSVMTWRTVTLANGEQKKDERKVTYKPQVRRIEVHPCLLKQDEPGYTGEKCPKVEPEEEETETAP